MIAWFARNGVAANLLLLVLVIGGIASTITTKRELFPVFSLDTVVVRVPFLGASPEDVEEMVIIRIEEAIQGIDGIKEITSTAQENLGTVAVTVDRGYDVARVKDEIKTRVDAIPSFPADTERPIVEELLFQKEVIRVSVFGEADERQIKEIAERVRDDLAELPEISQVVVQGTRAYEISIEVSETALRKYGLAFDDVVAVVRANSLDLPAGIIRAAGGEILLRAIGQAYTGEEFGAIPLLAAPDGGQALLRDVATVRDGFDESSIATTFNGKSAAIVLAYEVGDEDPIAISKAVHEYVEDARRTWLPEGIELEAWSDSSFYLQGRIDMLLENGMWGFLLVLVVLALFLRPSMAFFVAIGIPLSFLSTLAVAPLLGLTVNLLSLFAFILVLGIVVDDAIVISESVFTEFQTNGPGVESAIRGAKLVSTPVTFAVLTTMVAFIPILLLPGMMGKFMAGVPLVVIPTLAFSLVQAKLVLPYHLSLCRVGDRSGRETLNPLSRLQRKFSDGLERFVDRRYAPLLEKATRYRYLTLAVFVSGLILSLALVATGVVRFVFFPSVPSDYIFLSLEMAEGSPASETRRALDKIDAALERLRAQALAAGQIDPVRNKAVFYGYSVVAGGPSPSQFSESNNIGSIVLELAKSELRDSNANEVADQWRALVGELPGARRLNFMASASGPVGLPVDVRLAGRDFEELEAAAREIQERLRDVEGLYDIRDTYSAGKDELKIRLKESARSLGIGAADLARQVRAAFYGAEVQRVQRDKEDVKVMVRYPRAERESVAALERMRIVAPGGARVPIREVAEIELGEGFPAITRIDRQRVINIQAEADKTKLSTNEISQVVYEEIVPEVLARRAGVRVALGGEAKDMAEAAPAMLGGSLLVLALIYTLLAVPFRSYTQPLIVISVIPFGVAGAIFGHLWGPDFAPQDLSLLSFLGIIAMAGVVVNDSLVMVERTNSLLAGGMPLLEAALAAGRQRFRAVVLTSVTTFVGLAPIMGETSLQARFMIPMATSLAFGVLFATVITLFLVPCAYLVLEDVKRLAAAWWTGLLRGAR